MDTKIKHLEMIEAVAERMAKNSFTINLKLARIIVL